MWPAFGEEVMELSAPAWMHGSSQAPNSNWMTLKDAMKEFGVSRTTLYNWMSKGVKSRIWSGKRLVSTKDLSSLMGNR